MYTKKNELEHSWRNELKFVLDNVNIQNIIHIIRTNPYLFSEIFPQRKINNIYFDDLRFSSFSENIAGVSKRSKLRLRWYGKNINLIQNPTLELKIRNSNVGRKVKFFLQDSSFDLNEFRAHNFHWKILPPLPADMQKFFFKSKPTLRNSYTRRYFLSNCKKFRLTVDTNLEFNGINKRSRCYFSNSIILELKFAKEHKMEASKVMQHFPLRVVKSSKYVTGLSKISELPNIY